MKNLKTIEADVQMWATAHILIFGAVAAVAGFVLGAVLF